MNKICYGCGVKLQSKNPNELGYIPKDKLLSGVYCQRCFKIMHYGLESISATPKDINTIVNSINNDNRFVIFLIDFLSISDKVINIFKHINKDKILLISKCDIIPKYIKSSNIINYIRYEYGINDDIKLISSYNNFGIESFLKYLDIRNISESYVVGLSNSGKSTFINKILEVCKSDMNKITTSYIPNTTLDFIRISVNNKLCLIDSPGFIIPSLNNININKKNNIKGYIKPVTYQMKKGETLKLEDMYLNFNEDTSITLYMSNDIYSKKYFKETIFDDQIEVNDNNDLILYGLGFINIKKSCIIKIFNLPNKYLELRDSIFGGFNEQD